MDFADHSTFDRIREDLTDLLWVFMLVFKNLDLERITATSHWRKNFWEFQYNTFFLMGIFARKC